MKSARRPKQKKTYRDGPKIRKPQLKKRFQKRERMEEMKLENYPLHYELSPDDPSLKSDGLLNA